MAQWHTLRYTSAAEPISIWLRFLVPIQASDRGPTTEPSLDHRATRVFATVSVLDNHRLCHTWDHKSVLDFTGVKSYRGLAVAQAAENKYLQETGIATQ
ncbi:uncharacterized protein N7477_002971 [Penicillium maclennaniae]|uniref:uncharacterized protein n=1 Tax=Penicillium maclennaniae TaxID=1343394 RepID=UPI002540A626|nr:uncharacterized protein N7477_002971 [Penicillium maclennaniae]KAJ5677338.1 hypothetical protein N7477_002971 [Penicillium maclennaniae]